MTSIMNIIIEKLKLLNYYNEHTNDLIMYDSINDIIRCCSCSIGQDIACRYNIVRLIHVIEGIDSVDYIVRCCSCSVG